MKPGLSVNSTLKKLQTNLRKTVEIVDLSLKLHGMADAVLRLRPLMNPFIRRLLLVIASAPMGASFENRMRVTLKAATYSA